MQVIRTRYGWTDGAGLPLILPISLSSEIKVNSICDPCFDRDKLALFFRMQAQSSNRGAAYQGMSDVFRQTLKHEGYGGFYKGLLPNLLKVVPAASITYLVYERMKKWLELD